MSKQNNEEYAQRLASFFVATQKLYIELQEVETANELLQHCCDFAIQEAGCEFAWAGIATGKQPFEIEILLKTNSVGATNLNTYWPVHYAPIIEAIYQKNESTVSIETFLQHPETNSSDFFFVNLPFHLQEDRNGYLFFVGKQSLFQQYHELGIINFLMAHITLTLEKIEAAQQFATTSTKLEILRKAVQQSNASIVITDSKGNIEFVNAAFSKLTGYSKEEALGKNPRILKTGKTTDEEYQQLWNNLSTGKEWTGEFCNRKKNGDLYWENANISPVINDEGEISHFIAVKENITERKRIEAELFQAKELAEAASLAKSEFLANMSHEIRTPLNGIIGFSELLLNTTLTDTQGQYMGIINQSANSLLDIINSILDFSKIEAGKLEIDIEKTDLFQLCSQITDTILYQAQQKDLELLLSISPDIPRFIWTDAVRMRQVLINLLSNAIKFTKHGEVELKIELVEKLTHAHRYRFMVRDTGIGVAPENLGKIFRAFEQADSSTTRQFGGTGLGLSISNKLLQLMHGTNLQVTSTLGEGTTFFFELEIKTADGDAILFENKGNLKNALIVDDNQNNRIILKEMLAIHQIECVLTESGTHAIELLYKHGPYDIILMDYHMPELDGLDTISKIRKELKLNAVVQPIILLSSSADDLMLSPICKELNVVQRLTKPIKIAQLYQALEKVVATDHATLYGKPFKELPIAPSNKEPIQILVTDDNRVNLLLATTVLKIILPEAQITEAMNGLEAFEKCKSDKFDIVFMDIQMPILNGYEATHKIRMELGLKDLPIIALTAGVVSGEREKCVKAGMNDFITKPFLQEDLIAALVRYGIMKNANAS